MIKPLMRHLIIVEGNISAGKSTLCRELSQLLNMKEWSEPVVENPYLEKFYADPKGYALKMQLWLLRQRFETYLQALQHTMRQEQERQNGCCGVILDRSIFSDYVFAVKNYQDGNISNEGFNYYLELRDKMMHFLPLPAVTLYLDAKPEICFQRIHGVRGRDCETGIKLDYLQGLDECYQIMLQEMEKAGSHIMRLNWNEFGNVRSVANNLSDILEQQQEESKEMMNVDQKGLWSYVTELLQDEEKRRQVMYLDYTIEELEDDDIAATIVHTSSHTGKSNTSPTTPPRPSSCKHSATEISPHTTPEKSKV